MENFKIMGRIETINQNHKLINLNNKKEVLNSLYELTSFDLDLSENHEYFKKDTLKLGFKNESDRIAKECLKKYGYPKTANEFEQIAKEVFSSISTQDYYNECNINILEINKNNLSFAFVYGIEH